MCHQLTVVVAAVCRRTIGRDGVYKTSSYFTELRALAAAIHLEVDREDAQKRGAQRLLCKPNTQFTTLLLLG